MICLNILYLIHRGYRRAQQALREQNYEDIVPACTEELEEAESSAHRAEALLLRATMKQLLGEHKAAMSDFESVINDPSVDIKVQRFLIFFLKCFEMLSFENFTEASVVLKLFFPLQNVEQSMNIIQPIIYGQYIEMGHCTFFSHRIKLN